MRFIEIGRIVKAHGVQGRMKAVHFLDDEGLLSSLDAIFIAAGPEGAARSYRIRALESRGGALFLDLEGVADRDAAGALAGRFLLLPEDQAPPLAPDEYYWRDLLDMTVRTEAGEELGRITAIFPTGSNDVYVCTGPDREILLPAIAEVVREVDRAGKVMVVRLLEGL
jgi:16S rRNA processing protein RimM